MKYECFLASGFREKDLGRISKKIHKITNYFNKSRDGTLILTFLVGVHLRNIDTKFEAYTCNSLTEVKNVILHSNI